MSDTLPSEYGVNAHGPRARAGMSRDQREWHARMALLPRTVHSKTQRDEVERLRKTSEMSDTLSRARKGSERAYAAVAKAKKALGATPRTKSQNAQILAALQKGPLTPQEIAERFAAGRPSARIADLRDFGHDIKTERLKDGTYRYVLRNA